jgi:FkbM family methyltransferase
MIRSAVAPWLLCFIAARPNTSLSGKGYEKSMQARRNEMRVAPPYELVACRHGLMLANRHDAFMGRALIDYGECGELELQVLLSLLKFPGLVVEAGANMGIHTIPIARQLAAEGRRMLALEPQPVIFQQLCANLALNGLMNVTALPYACGTDNGALSFAVPDYNSPGNFGGTSMVAGLATSPHEETVQCVRLDDLVPDGAVGLIKIDVEGQELQVLQGCQRILERCQPVLYVENDRVELSAPLIQWLFDHGYRLWWHTPRLFNSDNFRRVAKNHYGEICSVNMLCVPRLTQLTVTGLAEIVEPFFHPCR